MADETVIKVTKETKALFEQKYKTMKKSDSSVTADSVIKTLLQLYEIAVKSDKLKYGETAELGYSIVRRDDFTCFEHYVNNLLDLNTNLKHIEWLDNAVDKLKKNLEDEKRLNDKLMNKVSNYDKLQKALTEAQTKASAAEAQVVALKDILREFKPDK